MINQIIITRNSRQIDEGTAGFHDYVTKLESFENFVKRVTDKANNINSDIVNITYPNDTTAIIITKSH